MTASERGEKVKLMVNAIYSALNAEGLIYGKQPQSMIKVTIAGAVMDSLYPPGVQVDVPSWGIGK